MAGKRYSSVQLQLVVTLNSQAYEFLEKNSRDSDLSGTLAGWCAFWAEQQARGGLMLSPEDHDFLAEENGGKRFKDSRALVAAIERGMNRSQGQYALTVKIDPAHYPALKENAEAGGLSVEESLDGIVQMIFASGWIYDFTPDQGRNVPFTYQMLQQCAALCDKRGVDSSDIAGLIAEDRLLPIDRETQAEIRNLAGEVTADSLLGLVRELGAARQELETLRKAPKELVAA